MRDFTTRRSCMLHWNALLIAVMCGGLPVERARAADAPHIETVVHSITGLFDPDREADFRTVLATMPEIEVTEIDYAAGEATLKYDRKKAFNGGTDEQVVERLDARLRGASRSTFGAKKRASLPKEQLVLVEISVVGVDCKGCALAAYESIYKIEGVERATASFRDERVTALIDPVKTNREALIAALKARNVAVKEARDDDPAVQ